MLSEGAEFLIIILHPSYTFIYNRIKNKTLSKPIDVKRFAVVDFKSGRGGGAVFTLMLSLT